MSELVDEEEEVKAVDGFGIGSDGSSGEGAVQSTRFRGSTHEEEHTQSRALYDVVDGARACC